MIRCFHVTFIAVLTQVIVKAHKAFEALCGKVAGETIVTTYS